MELEVESPEVELKSQSRPEPQLEGQPEVESPKVELESPEVEPEVESA